MLETCLAQTGGDDAAGHAAGIKGEIEGWTRLRSRP